MVIVTGVRFRQTGKMYYFDPNGMEMHAGDGVIVETARGLEYGTCVAGCIEVEEKDGKLIVTFTVPAEIAEDYATGSGTSEEPKGETGFDIYYDTELDGNVSSGLYYSVDDVFEVE